MSPPVEEMTARATEAASFLKVLAHEGRMKILCHLAHGEGESRLYSIADPRAGQVVGLMYRLFCAD
ncbi:hypothetical protein FNJ84_15975 [Paracoccus sp. M683]|nr:hypothetical protein FNJ84_15975 [Paracoccus sp. M683]